MKRIYLVMAQLFVVEVQHVSAHFVEKVGIMAHDEQRAVPGGSQVLGQPDARVQIYRFM